MDDEHFNQLELGDNTEVKVSSLGIGTYKGTPTKETDQEVG